MESFLTLKQARKKILPLAMTMATTTLMNVCGGFLCMMMVAQLGHEVLAASALMISTQISIMVIAMSLLFSLSVLVGHAYGAKNFHAIGNFLQQGWTLATLVGIPILFLFWFIGPALQFFGQSPALIPYVEHYFHGYIWGVLPVLWVICHQQLCFGIHQQRMVVGATFLSTIVLLVAAYVFIFGKLGLPALGVMGLGYAMALAAWTNFLIMTALLYHRHCFKDFDLFSYRIHKSWDCLKQMFKIGWPISLQISTEMLSFFVIVLMVGWIGQDQLAAYQVVNQYVFLVVVPIFSLAQASGIAVGQANGAKEFHNIKSLGYASLQIALIYAILAGAIFILFPKALASLYFDTRDPKNAATLYYVVWLFLFVAFGETFDSVRNIMTGALRGLFDTRFPMYIGILCIWFIFVPFSYVLAFPLHWGIFGIAAGSTFGFFIGAIIIWMRWRNKIRVIAHPIARNGHYSNCNNSAPS